MFKAFKSKLKGALGKFSKDVEKEAKEVEETIEEPKKEVEKKNHQKRSYSWQVFSFLVYHKNDNKVQEMRRTKRWIRIPYPPHKQDW